MSLFSAVFGNKAPTQAAVKAANADSQSAENSQIQAPAEPKPLEKFEKVWTAPEKASDESSNSVAKVSPEDMMAAAGKIDFSRLIDQDTLQQINGGGEGAMQALVAVINKTAQTSFGQSMIAAQKLVDAAVQEAKKDFSSQVPSMVKSQQLKAGLYDANPALKNPAVAPIVDALQLQLANHYPKASVAELQSMAQEMMVGAARAFDPKSFEKPVPKVPKNQDWSDLV